MRGEKPGPDMFDEAMKQEVTAEPGQEDTRAKRPEDMFEAAGAEAAETEVELTDEDLEEVKGDMFDLAGAQVVDQRDVPKPVRLEGQAEQASGDMFDEAMKKDMFEQAQEKAELESARMAIDVVSGEAGEEDVPSLPETGDFEVPEAPPKAEEVIEVSDEDIISSESLPDADSGDQRKAA